MEIPRDLAEKIARLRKFQNRELKQRLIVRLEMDLPTGLQHLAVQLQKSPVGQGSQKLM